MQDPDAQRLTAALKTLARVSRHMSEAEWTAVALAICRVIERLEREHEAKRRESP